MDTPIIDPWLWYWINTAPDLLRILFISVVMGIAIYSLVQFMFSYLAIERYSTYHRSLKEGEEGKVAAKHVKKGIIWAIILIFPVTFLALIPDKSTLIEMLVLENITANKVETAVDTGRNLKNEIKRDIIDIIQALKEEPSTKK